MSYLEDLKFMKIALKLGQKGKGFTEPNPMVGAVVVKDGKILARGYHKRYGSHHAERAALEKVKAPGTTLYVTLEPCCHYGNTPPCTEIIVKKKVKRVVVAMHDPNPRVNCNGIDLLSKHGIKVEVGLCGDMAARLNRHYLEYITRKLPYVAINAGVSIDGKMTDKYGKSQWITDRQLRNYSHSLRGEFSAILAGVKTILVDDPQLTIREKAWKNKSLYRVILDSGNVMDKSLRIFQEQERFPLVIFSAKDAKNRERKVDHHFFITRRGNGLFLEEVLHMLSQMGIASVLVEGGGQIIDSFLQAGLYDEILLFTADKLIGGKESVEFFAGGTELAKSAVFREKEVVEFDSGYLVRGLKA